MANEGIGNANLITFGGGAGAADPGDAGGASAESSGSEEGRLSQLMGETVEGPDGESGNDGGGSGGAAKTKESTPSGRKAAERIQQLVSERNETRQQLTGLQQRVGQLEPASQVLQHYSQFENPVAAMDFDRRFVDALSELRDGDPEAYRALEPIIAKVKEGGIALETRPTRTEAQATTRTEQQGEPGSSSWVEKHALGRDVTDVLKHENVRADLHKNIRDAVIPVLLKDGEAPTEQRILEAIAAYNLSQGWSTDFLVGKGERSQKPSTGGRQASATATRVDADPGTTQTTKVEPPKTAQEADRLRRAKAQAFLRDKGALSS